ILANLWPVLCYRSVRHILLRRRNTPPKRRPWFLHGMGAGLSDPNILLAGVALRECVPGSAAVDSRHFRISARHIARPPTHPRPILRRVQTRGYRRGNCRHRDWEALVRLPGRNLPGGLSIGSEATGRRGPGARTAALAREAACRLAADVSP